MADQLFMFVTTAGTMIGLAALLFVSKGIRMRSGGLTATPTVSLSSSSLDKENYNNAGRKVKKYSSDGKPIYED
ncbi:MAG TPA: hypothetical protein VE643_04805 [Nitrososphaeraceae archaeon]|nr:hypothetical protein [Nitrososphaeraceae archaeon]